MKRYFIFLIALMAIATGAKAVTYYGFTIDGVAIHSGNNNSPSSNNWYYEPSVNVLHLNDWPGSIIIDGDANPNMKVSVDKNVYGQSIEAYEMLTFIGSGNHVVYGNGNTLNLNRWCNTDPLITGRSVEVIQLKDKSKVTFQDINLKITCDLLRSRLAGFGIFTYTGDNHLTFNHSSVSISVKANGSHTAVNSSGRLYLNRCSLVEGTVVNRGDYDAILDVNGNLMNEITIQKQLILVDHLSFTVNQPVAGQPLQNTVVTNGEIYSTEVIWGRMGSSNEDDQILENGYVCKLGETYRVAIFPQLYDGYGYADNVTASINEKSSSITDWGEGVKMVSYTFPQLANTYYNLWVGGRQVNDQNQNDVLGDGGTVKFLSSGFLYLTDAHIKNTGNPDFEYTGYGRGIYSGLQNLYVSVRGDNTIESSGEGIYFTGELSLIGSNKTTNTLNIKGSSGIRTNANGTVLNVYNMTLTAEGTSSMGIGGPIIGNKNCTLTVSGASTVVKAWGSFLSLGHLKDLQRDSGLEIASPAGAYFGSNNVRYANGDAISKQWVIIRGETSISTDIDQVPSDKYQVTSDDWYTIDGRKLNGKPAKKGVYINNGKKAVVK